MRLVNPKLKLARDRKEKKQWCAILWTLSVTIREDSRNVHVSIGHKPKVHSKVLESAQYICKVQCMASKLASARHLTFAVNRSLARVSVMLPASKSEPTSKFPSASSFVFDIASSFVYMHCPQWWNWFIPFFFCWNVGGDYSQRRCINLNPPMTCLWYWNLVSSDFFFSWFILEWVADNGVIPA